MRVLHIRAFLVLMKSSFLFWFTTERFECFKVLWKFFFGRWCVLAWKHEDSYDALLLFWRGTVVDLAILCILCKARHFWLGLHFIRRKKEEMDPHIAITRTSEAADWRAVGWVLWHTFLVLTWLMPWWIAHLNWKNHLHAPEESFMWVLRPAQNE